MTEYEKNVSQPLPIWFFVGLLLSIYGVILVISDLIGDSRPTVLAETRPALWWGALTTAAGAIFLWIGLRVRKRPQGDL